MLAVLRRFRPSLDFIIRCWIYFRRGHSGYLAFLVSLANFVVIQYRLLIEHVPLLKMVFASLIAFVLTFVFVYVPLAIFLGWLDARRLTGPRESTLTAEISPWHRDITYALYLIAQGRNEEAAKILDKWIKRFEELQRREVF
jgi:hypothetical protein